MSPLGRNRWASGPAQAACALLAALLLGLAGMARAQAPSPDPRATVVIVSNSELAYHSNFAETFRKHFRQANPEAVVVSIDTRDEDVAKQLKNPLIRPQLVVAVGKTASTLVSHSRYIAPVLYTLISRDTHRLLPPTPHASALYIDQPIARTLGLIRSALPEVHRISTLLGPQSQGLGEAIETAAQALSLEAHLHRIDRARELNTALYQAFNEGEVFVSFPDPLVVNRQTAKNIILSAYLKHIPIVGYSESLVKAGALMAVYSTPRQLAVQAAQISTRLLTEPDTLRQGPFYPEDFSVAVNYQVARAFGLNIDSQERLKARLLQGPEAQ